uniref:Uncharacterized protein n=1 Tax=Anguilla anguilla TaxID=7936 RepID=A0A0E9SZE6_ANGAN
MTFHVVYLKLDIQALLNSEALICITVTCMSCPFTANILLSLKHTPNHFWGSLFFSRKRAVRIVEFCNDIMHTLWVAFQNFEMVKYYS